MGSEMDRYRNDPVVPAATSAVTNSVRDRDEVSEVRNCFAPSDGAASALSRITAVVSCRTDSAPKAGKVREVTTAMVYEQHSQEWSRQLAVNVSQVQDANDADEGTRDKQQHKKGQ